MHLLTLTIIITSDSQTSDSHSHGDSDSDNVNDSDNRNNNEMNNTYNTNNIPASLAPCVLSQRPRYMHLQTRQDACHHAETSCDPFEGCTAQLCGCVRSSDPKPVSPSAVVLLSLPV